MKFSELRDKSAAERQEILLKTKREMMNIRFRKASGEQLNANKLKYMRKTVAQIKTLGSQISQKNGDVNA